MNTIDAEFSQLKSFFGGYYYQTVWDDYSSHEEIWKQYIEEDNIEGIKDLLDNINKLLEETPLNILNIVEEIVKGGGISFDTPEEAVGFLERLRLFLEK